MVVAIKRKVELSGIQVRRNVHPEARKEGYLMDTELFPWCHGKELSKSLSEMLGLISISWGWSKCLRTKPLPAVGRFFKLTHFPCLRFQCLICI